MTTWVIRLGIVLAAVLAVALVIGAIVKGYESWRDAVKAEGLEAGRAEIQSKWDDDRAKAQEAAIAAAVASAAETARRLKAQQENERAHQNQLAQARADAGRARAAADGLRLRASAYLDAAGCGTVPSDTAIACIRQAATALGNALGQCGEIARGIAADADDARARGQLCEASYESLTLKP